MEQSLQSHNGALEKAFSLCSHSSIDFFGILYWKQLKLGQEPLLLTQDSKKTASFKDTIVQDDVDLHLTSWMARCSSLLPNYHIYDV